MKWFIMSFVPVGPFLPDVGPGHSSFWVFLEAFTQASSTCPKEVAFLSDSLRPSSLFPLSLWLREPTGGDGPLGGGGCHNSAPLGIRTPPPFPVSYMTSRSSFGGTSLDSQGRKQKEGARGRIQACELR